MVATTKSLIAFFSRKGNNYVGSRIVNLPIGNTEVIAKKIRGLTGSDLFQIQTVQPYPEDYTEATRVAQDELSPGENPVKVKLHYGIWV